MFKTIQKFEKSIRKKKPEQKEIRYHIAHRSLIRNKKQTKAWFSKSKQTERIQKMWTSSMTTDRRTDTHTHSKQRRIKEPLLTMQKQKSVSKTKKTKKGIFFVYITWLHANNLFLFIIFTGGFSSSFLLLIITNRRYASSKNKLL